MGVPSKLWLGGVALSGLLLVASTPVVTAASQPSRVPLTMIKAAQISTGTYAQIVHEDLKWVPQDVQAKVVVAEPKKEVVAVAPATATSASNTATKPEVEKKKAVPQRPVQVAQLPNQQASRGGSSSGGTSIVNRALGLQGVPYRFGGSTTNGFDCSGFTQYVFKSGGVSLPRTSYDQFKVGSSVSKDQLKPGDLVFFTTYSSGASHVGIYVGGGKFVHASDSGVTTTSLSESYYLKRYLGARRVQ